MARKPRKAKERLGNKIQRIRKSLGYNQEELAELVGISRTHVGHIEQGRKAPSLEVLEKISKVLKVPLSQLFS
jgi:transcriptional regulator with XRE-family HTH domain